MPDELYQMQPINSVMQGLSAPVPDSPIEPVAKVDNSQNMQPLVQTQQMGGLSTPSSMPQPAPDTYLQQLGNLNNQIANYQTFEEKHPHWSALLGVKMSPQDEAKLAAWKRQSEALQAIQKAKQDYATNQTHLGMFNTLAQHGGLSQAVPGSVLSKDDLTLAQAQANRFGSPEYAKRIMDYQQALMDHARQQQALETYNARKSRGLLSADELKAGAPQVGAAPVLNLQEINPYLTAGEVSGITGTSGEAARTGMESGQHAASNATTEKEAEARLDELRNQLNYQKQVHEDTVAQQEANRQQDERHFGVTSGQKDREIQLGEEKNKSDFENRQANMRVNQLKAARDNVNTWLTNANNLMTQRFGKDKTGRIKAPKDHNSPEYQSYLQMTNAIAGKQSELEQLNQAIQGGQGQPSRSPSPAPVSQPTGKTLNQHQKTLKGAKRTLDALSKIGL